MENNDWDSNPPGHKYWDRGHGSGLVEKLLESSHFDRSSHTELERLLREDDDALREYLILTDLDARLRWAFRGGGSSLSATKESAVSSVRTSPRRGWHVKPRLRPQGASSAARSVTNSASAGLKRRALYLSAAASIVILLTWTALRVASDDRIVATLTQSTSVRWGEPHQHLLTGDSIGNEDIVLLAGTAEITLRNETRLVIEAPAAFRILNEERAQISLGVMSVFVGERARGFSLQTPDVNVVDLGTAFQARLDSRGTEVHVIKGMVSLTPLHVDKKDEHGDVRLSARDAARIDRADGTISTVKFAAENLNLYGQASLAAVPSFVKGDIRCLDHAPSSVVVGEFEDDHVMQLFLERNNVVLDRTLYADRNALGEVATQHGNLHMAIPAGAKVTSYLLHFDPTTKRESDRIAHVSGSVTFRSPILGVFTTSSGIYESDKYLRNEHTEYSRDGVDANRSVDKADSVVFSPDRKTITVNFAANWAADQMRIVTAADDQASLKE